MKSFIHNTSLSASTAAMYSASVVDSAMVITRIFKTLRISYYNGKVGVYLCGGVGFESCPMHVINVLIYYLFIYMYLKSDILFYSFHVVCRIHYDSVISGKIGL